MSKSTKDIISKLGPLIGLILLIIVVSILNPSFLAISNIFNVLRQVSISAIIAFGMTFVILTGGIDLSVGSTLALTGAVAASLLAGGTDPIVSMGITLILGLILGAFNGLIITKGKVAPFIATLATMTIYRGLNPCLYGRQTDFRFGRPCIFSIVWERLCFRHSGSGHHNADFFLHFGFYFA